MHTHTTCSGPVRVAVTTDGSDEGLHEAAAALARELGLPLAEPGSGPDDETELCLVVGPRRLELRDASLDRRGSVLVDFVNGPVAYRRRSAVSRRQPLALAVGLRHGPVTVVDATAGLARDSFLLASLGCTVIAVERSVVLGALVRDGLARAVANGPPRLRAVLERLTLIVDDARDVLSRMTGDSAPDAVYLDPMYPPKKKTALPKKEMRICRRLVGDDPDAAGLLEIARRVARRRVVVKRHPHAPPLGPAPALRFTGKQARYDVYLAQQSE